MDPIENSAILDSIKNRINESVRLISQNPTDTSTKYAQGELVLSLKGIDVLSVLADQSSKKTLHDLRVRAIVALSKSIGKDQASVEDLSEAMQGMSLKESKKNNPYYKGIDTTNPEDAAILTKIMRSVIRRPCGGYRTFYDYAGSDPIKRFIRAIAIDRFKYENFKTAHPQTEAILLFGPPGTGKTLLAEATASELPNATFISITSSDIKGRYVGESEKSISYLFKLARNFTRGDGGKGEVGKNPCVIFLDEIDGLIDEGASGVGTGLLAQFNAEVQGFKGESNQGLIVIAATNYPEKIPPAAFQRFSHRIFVGLPSLDNIREIIIKKLKRIGWSRVNFSKPNTDRYPMWLQGVDWDREKFITNFLTDTTLKRIYSIPGTYSVGDDESRKIVKDESRFLKIASEGDLEKILSPDKGDEFFDVFLGTTESNDPILTQCPWDVVDFMTLFFFNRFYAPREIDAVFSMMSINAEMRSLYFATQNPISLNKTYYQKWLMEKKIVKMLQDEKTCKYSEVPRYSLIPLWYTTADEGAGGESERTQLLNFVGDDLEKFNRVKLGEVYGIIRKVTPDGKVTEEQKPKFNLKKKNEEIKVVVTKVVEEDVNPVGMELKGKVKPETKHSFSFARKQADDKTEIMFQPVYTFVPTVEWTGEGKETLNNESIHRVLGISQINLDDFLSATQDIRSISIRNVDKMIEYAKSYGRSLKDGADIQQLVNQAKYMDRKNSVDADRYGDIFRQFISAILDAYGTKSPE